MEASEYTAGYSVTGAVVKAEEPRTGCSLGFAPGCDAGGREFEAPTGPTLRVFK